MKEHFSSRVTKLLVILALAIVASVMFVIVGCDGGEKEPTHTVHSWVADSSKTNIAPTCTTDGVDYFICSECGMTSTEPVPATGHTWDSDGTKGKPATCTEDGWYFYRECTECGYVDASDRMPATGHMLDFNTVSVTPPTCTADGSITGTCANGCGETVTFTADEITAETVKNLPKKNPDNKTEWFGQANAAGQTFLQALGHDYRYVDNVTGDAEKTVAPCIAQDALTKKDANGDPIEYWNYCERCKTSFEVEDHTAPANAVPCQYAKGSAEYSYYCEVCHHGVKPVGHSMQVMEKVGEDEYGDDIFEPVAEGTVLDCRYYSVCEWCGKVEVAKAHTYPTADDVAHYRNCAHGDICTVCGDELNKALAHDFEGTDGKFGTHTGNTTYTCTENGYTYAYCTMCKAREEAGEEVEWVLYSSVEEGVRGNAAGNYKVTGFVAASHDWEVEAAPIDPLTSDPTAINCMTGEKDRNVCADCGTVRIEVRPTVYTDKDMKKEFTGNSLEADKTYYIKGDDGKAKEINSTNFSMSTVTPDSAYKWTDGEGYWTEVEPDEHKLYAVQLSEYTSTQYIEYDAPNCIGGGNVLYRCDVCGFETWKELTDETKSYDEKTGEYTGTYFDRDKNVAMIDPTNHAAKNEMLACGAHDKHMTTADHYCGADKEYSYCSACATGNHNVQYTLTLKFTVNSTLYPNVAVPQNITYNVYACWPQELKAGQLTAAIVAKDLGWTDNGDSTYSDKNYTYEFTKFDVSAADVAENEPSFKGNIDIAVKAAPKVDYTINFVSGSALVADGLLEKAYESDKAFESDRDEDGNQVIFADREVYVLTTDKAQRAPELSGYNLFFYTKEDGKAVTFSFGKFDFDSYEGDSLTIYVVARERVNG